MKSNRVGLDDHKWDRILSLVAETKCTPFIGAGAASTWIPLASHFSNEWSTNYGYPLDDSYDLSRVAQYLAIKRVKIRNVS
ncbi:MAG: hypothetical protein P0116_16810 [Candidatus Nitrosocosmicus sp.]|nr:hypothetical protein [Candidatus Nitrosocosmicus sp.]